MSDIVDNLKKFVEVSKARNALKKSQENKAFADRLHKALGAPKIMSPQAPTSANSGNIPKITAPKAPSSSNSAGVPKITTVKSEKKVLIRPDVVSKPETFNEDGKSVSRPATLSGPTSMNVRKAEPLKKPWESKAQARWGHSSAGKKALGGEAAVHEWDQATHGKKLPEKVGKAQLQVQDKHDEINPENYINHELQLAEKTGEQLYHIKDGPMRITQKPMSLKDITAKHGPVQKLESAGFRVVPHTPEPSQPGTPLRRST